MCVLPTSRKLFKKFIQMTSRIEQGSRVKGKVGPAGVNVQVRNEAKRTERGPPIRSPRFVHDCGYAAR